MASLLISVTKDFAALKCFSKDIDNAPVPVPSSNILFIEQKLLPINKKFFERNLNHNLYLIYLSPY